MKSDTSEIKLDPNADYSIVEEELFRAQEEKAKLWVARWPHYCQACKGWGGHSTLTRADDLMNFDVCEATPTFEQCHRCGKAGLDEEGAGPCTACGWDYDDGVPSV